MAELRKDPLLERWVLIAEERAEKPQEFVDRPVVRRSGSCPFCEGSELETPHEVLALRKPGTPPDSPGWRVRVIPNKYPAVTIAGRNATATIDEGCATEVVGHQRRSAAGVHEVIIESPSHVVRAGELSLAQTADVLSIFRARLLALRAEPNLRYVQIFRNVGEAAGASIEHLHSQLIGLPVVPTLIAEESSAALAQFQKLSKCAFCEQFAGELKAGNRIVEATDDFVLFCPYASRFPYEMCLAPRRHAADFDSADDANITQIASLLRRGLSRLEAVCDFASYNCVLHTAPLEDRNCGHYHWHWEILPRIVKAAGFEWGTGVHINPVSPERAAAMLRAAVVAP